MHSTSICPQCAVPLHTGIARTNNGSCREIHYCLRCGLQIAGKDRPDVAIEWESYFYIQVKWTSTITLAQIKALREVDTLLGAKPAAKALQALRHTSAIRLGPWYSKPEATRVMEQLHLVGLHADLQLDWAE